MTFLKINHLPYAIGAIFLIVLVFFFLNRNYFKWIYTYWFFERTWTSRIATFFYYLSFILFIVALLDLRGPTEKVSANLPDQKTIIILDSSASMLAEDVRPSRFAKAIQLARHFVKKAAAHQIAVVLFSDVQKRLIPFTDDIDLLDSRLSALEKTNAISGGSNISQAIAEAASYFSTDGDADNASGNILVFTDAEESEDKFPLKLGSKINLAVVGLGTAKGGPIPLRWDDGSFRGYKTSKGEQITTKLDENYIKNLGKGVDNYRYWISNSYSLPTDEILGFFKGNYNKVHGQGDMTIRPVLSFYLIIPAILSFIISIILGRFPTFKKAVLALCLVFNPYWLSAQEKKEEKKELPAYVQGQLNAFKSGKLNRSEILKLGEEFLKNERPAESLQLYEEYATKEDSVEVKFNHATAYLENKKIKEALPLIKDVLASDAQEALKNKMRSNLLLAMKQNDSKDNQQKQDQKDKDEKKEDQKEDNKDQQQDSKDKNEKQDDKKSDDQKNEGKDQKGDGKSQKNDNGKDQDKKENEGDKPEKNEPKDLKAPPRESKPQTLDEKEKQVEQQRKMVKTPAMVKQILDDDRELQKRMMDTSTKANSKNKRDW